MVSFKGISFTLLVVIFMRNKLCDADTCSIPRGEQYRRSVFRPQNGSNTHSYEAGLRVNSGTTIVIICRANIYHDMVIKRSLSSCQNGRWFPSLPKCDAGRRCHAPPTIQYATAAEHISQNITFPHGSLVTYICDVDKMATGNNTIACENGEWSETNFSCESTTINETQQPSDVTVTLPLISTQETLTTMSSDVPLCEEIGITNGRISRQNNDVTCDEGFQMISSTEQQCRLGRWIGPLPLCVPVKTDCEIPRGSQYSRTIYRSKTDLGSGNYPAGTVLSNGTQIVVICQKDIYGDVITNWTFSECQSGKWIPALPSCQVKKRCQVPEEIGNAEMSETITPHKTFPHGTTVTYICDVGKMATGNDTIVCNDGLWSETDFTCRDYLANTSIQTPIILDSYTLDNACSQLTVQNGEMAVIDNAKGTYDVTCDVGYRLLFEMEYICRDGSWIGKEPKCRKVPSPCIFSSYARRLSVLVNKETGEVIDSIFVEHMTQVLQTCKTKSTRKRRTVRCVYGRWRPRLMSCRSSRRSKTFYKFRRP